MLATACAYLLGFVVVMHFGGIWLLRKILPERFFNPAPEQEAPTVAATRAAQHSSALVDDEVDRLEQVRQATSGHRFATATGFNAAVAGSGLAAGVAASASSFKRPVDADESTAVPEVPVLQDVMDPDEAFAHFSASSFEEHLPTAFEDNDEGALA